MKTKLFAESNPLTDLGAFAMEDLYCTEYVVTGTQLKCHSRVQLSPILTSGYSSESCVTMPVANKLLQVGSSVNKYQSLSLTGKESEPNYRGTVLRECYRVSFMIIFITVTGQLCLSNIDMLQTPESTQCFLVPGGYFGFLISELFWMQVNLHRYK